MYAIWYVEKAEITAKAGTPTLDQMKEAVGGYICSADRMPSKSRKGVEIDVYCNDEGLLMDLPLAYFRRDGSPIVGNIVVTGANRSGNTVPLTQAEIRQAFATMGINMEKF